MSLSSDSKNRILQLLLDTVRAKLLKYQPETSHMPFHYRLLGRDRYAMFSFMQSMNTTFGMCLWEQIAVILAEAAGSHAERQYKLLGQIDAETEGFIQDIHRKLREAKLEPDAKAELKGIRSMIRKGQAEADPDSVVDLFVKVGKVENYFDITSAKPNMKEFAALKLKLLRWTGLRLSRDGKAVVRARLAVPYNPYQPEPYERWTMKGLYDLGSGEVLVGEDFWNFVAGGDVYDSLLDVFQEAGEDLRAEIDDRFSRV